MSEEQERKRAIAAGADIFGNCNINTRGGIERLLDAGWVPPAQREEELRRTAEWQRDARKVFEVVESVIEMLDEERYVLTAQRLRDALGVRFSTPTPQAGS